MKRKLTVTELNVIKTFKNKNGGESTIYEVFAVSDEGEPITQTLRSFDTLPVNELIEVDVSRYVHEKYGESYTLSLSGGGGAPSAQGGGGSPSPGARLGPKVDELRARVEELEKRIARLESQDSSKTTSPAATAGDEIPW